MAKKNLPPREKRIRQSQNTKYKDYVCETNNNKEKNKVKKLPCTGCDLVFEKRDLLLLHQATSCLTLKVDMTRPRSFFANQKPKTPTKSTPTAEKKRKYLSFSATWGIQI